jgi:hypothetical protein
MQQTQIASRLIGLLPRQVRTRTHVDPHPQPVAEAAGDQGKFDDAAGCSGGVANIRSEPVGVSPALGPVPAISVARPSRREEPR